MKMNTYKVVAACGGAKSLDDVADLLLLGEPDRRCMWIRLCEIGDNVVLLIVEADESNCDLVDRRGHQLQSIVGFREGLLEFSNVLFQRV